MRKFMRGFLGLAAASLIVCLVVGDSNPGQAQRGGRGGGGGRGGSFGGARGGSVGGGYRGAVGPSGGVRYASPPARSSVVGPQGGVASGVRQGGVAVGPGGSVATGGRQGGVAQGPAGGTVIGGSRGGSVTTPGGSTISAGGRGGVYVGPGGNVVKGGSKGASVTGPGGNTVSGGARGGVAVGPGGAIAGGSRGAVATGPGGTVAAGGRGGVAVGPGGAVAGGSRGAIAAGPAGVVAGGARGGVAVGPRGAVAAGSRGAAVAHRTYPYSPTFVHSHAVAVRRDFIHYNCFTPGWYRAHPVAWTAAAITAASVWASCSYASVATYCGYPATPIEYDYGTNVVYQDDQVYVGGEPVATAEEYATQATAIADTGREAKPEEKEEWKPLGVFGMVQENETIANTLFQLAINKQGVLRGNYYNALTETTLPVYGSVDAKTQRAAWTVGENKAVVYETGLDNLTKPESSVLIHFGKDKTQQWMLVRIEQPEEGKQPEGGESK